MKKPALSRSQLKKLRSMMLAGGFSYAQVQREFEFADSDRYIDLYRRFVGPLPTDSGGVRPVRGKAKKPSMVPYSILLPESLLSQYRSIAESESRPLSQVIRDVLKDHLKFTNYDDTT